MEWSAPPPPYREVDSSQPPSNTVVNFRVPRKPVQPVHTERPKTAPSRNDDAAPPVFFEEFEKLKQSGLQTHPLPVNISSPRRDVSLNAAVYGSGSGSRSENGADAQLCRSSSYAEPASGKPCSSDSLYAPAPLRHATSNVSLNPSPKILPLPALSYVQDAFREARHFAGGLITHPVESTKHFSILRHSHGLVFYQGAETTLAISIFADDPLPPERTIWLQSRGWSGKTGMRARAFMGMNGNWINVTPSLNVGSEQLKPSDERAWQRDIAHFRKKANSSRQQYHTLRETAIVRIPEEAEDGYFQFVLCLGNKHKTLCPSPVFRIISSSTSPGMIRGASLSTLPLELGAIAFGKYARNTAGRVVGPVAAVVQNRAQKFMPLWVTQQATSLALGAVKSSDHMGTQVADGRNVSLDGLSWAFGTGDPSIEEGPQAPYPLRFMANSEPATIGTEQFNMPGMVLTGIPINIGQHLSGYFLGWARFVKQPMMRKSSRIEDETWFPAVISALPTTTVPGKKDVIVRLTRDYDEAASDRRVIEIRIMGLIRLDDVMQRDAIQRGLQARDDEAAEVAMLAEMNDILLAENILDRPAWNPEAVPRVTPRAGSSSADFIRMGAQKQISKLPFHKLGVRCPADGVRNTPFAANGYYVRR
ncbi:uncharacterized protein L3040_002822 [Drepanopeziza brunnea f. sp. 'multigermtubi']|uniref:LipA and NB-ARC domain protein n=1 Tax=Marssonina brunnea f. sp. multigermtubi (strain MB_m1) TaxID=1072389 RepID=K1XQA7_MARBU|nr:LipA and NB-ARC domain protein [Drepanopeziza brunnea f. sp. 'multigermtubi' MB_m1]EKD14749.1 LipA and NB-ARC domain protein [Drepanopeziza brunnea f. sp. 'multigermtubi' MB_m1]KAJ5050955.1 hypothetical protein L3040_002822 [Drepanopeziza brunnea f. sp. 'multigermtubi']